MLLCLFDLILYVNNHSVTSGQVFLGWTRTKLGLMCLAQRHNAVALVRLESAALRSPSLVKHSSTEPLCSLTHKCLVLYKTWNGLEWNGALNRKFCFLVYLRWRLGFWSSLPSSTKNNPPKTVKVGPPLTKHSWSRCLLVICTNAHVWKFSGLFLNSGFWGWLSMLKMLN